MMYCRSCGKSLHESALFCPHCGYNFRPAGTATPSVADKPSIWMAITAMTLSILVLLMLLAVFGQLESIKALSQIESALGSHTLKQRMAEDAYYSAIGGLVLGLPPAVLGIVSLVQQRGGRGMAIASVVIGAINLFLILALFGLSLE